MSSEEPRNRAYDRAVSVLQDVAQPEGLPMAERIALAQVWATLAQAYEQQRANEALRMLSVRVDECGEQLRALTSASHEIQGPDGIFGVRYAVEQLTDEVRKLGH